MNAQKPPKKSLKNPDLKGVKKVSVKSKASLTANTLPVAINPDKNVLQLYMKELGRYPLLTPEEEKELTTRYFESKDPVVFKRIVQSNLRFVVKIAFEYARYGAKVLDLIQEGNVGLLKAVQDFNPYKDVRLTTYAVWWIRSYIQDYLLRNWSIVRVGTTAAQKKLFYRLKKEQEKFEREGLKPQAKQIAMNLGVTENEVESMQGRMSGQDLSLSAPMGQDRTGNPMHYEQRVADESPSASSTMEQSEQAELFKTALEEFMDELETRDQEIFKARLLSENPKTLLEIGEIYGFSKERARQIEERLKQKLKAFLAKHYPDISVD